MTVRPAQTRDTEQVAEVFSGAPKPREEAGAIHLAKQFRKPLRCDGSGDWVIEIEEELIGWVGLRRRKDDRDTLEPELYLRCQYQRKHRGQRLFEEFVYSAAREARILKLTATPHTQPAVTSLRRLGFSDRNKQKKKAGDAIADRLHEALPDAADVGAPWDLIL